MDVICMHYVFKEISNLLCYKSEKVIEDLVGIILLSKLYHKSLDKIAF